jgi:hypothetical protein
MARWTISEPHGAAVIRTPVAALPDMVEHERIGLIVILGNAKDWLLTGLPP